MEDPDRPDGEKSAGERALSVAPAIRTKVVRLYGQQGNTGTLSCCTVEVFAKTAEYYGKQTTEIIEMELPMHQVEQGPDARRWARHKIDVRLKVSFLNEGKSSSAFGRANSLSRGGIGAYIPCSIPVGTTVGLELRFPYTSTEARIEAIIRSCEGFRYGLEFTRISDDVQEMIVKNCSGTEQLQ